MLEKLKAITKLRYWDSFVHFIIGMGIVSILTIFVPALMGLWVLLNAAFWFYREWNQAGKSILAMSSHKWIEFASGAFGGVLGSVIMILAA